MRSNDTSGAWVRMLALAAVVMAASCHAETAPITVAPLDADDPIRQLQNEAIAARQSPVAHWGYDPTRYVQWSNHSNRLIPVYTFGTKEAVPGVDLNSYFGEKSPYRSEEALERIYGYLPPQSVDARALQMDQTNLYDLQRAAIKAGKKHVFLVIFDGMDWHATRAAAVARGGQVYTEGRGTGLFFQDYLANGNTQFGFMATAPYGDKARDDVDNQTVATPEPEGGYSIAAGGAFPWSTPPHPEYYEGKDKTVPHTFTDSACSASSMNAGIKTYNAALNVKPDGSQAETVAHQAQKQGYLVGSVTSVPFCHATPAATYAHNVSRNDYQDLARDMLGLKSIAHPVTPLPGMDLVIGTGDRIDKKSDKDQGKNFVPGNVYLTDEDLKTSDVAHGGRYVISRRTDGEVGGPKLLANARKAAAQQQRLFGFYGSRHNHLPYQTANGDYLPARDSNGSIELYTEADRKENPTLREMTEAALAYFTGRAKPFWLMVEAGDVDFAEHNNNLDTMIGAIYSGDEAVRAIVEWVEKHSNWEESLLIVTADHGHYLVVEQPEKLAGLARPQAAPPALGAKP